MTGSRPAAASTPAVQPLVLLLSLYLAQGLPGGFLTQALPAILRQYQVSLGWIGFSGILLAPASFKFLWAPWVDRHFLPQIGQSRSWILPTQVGALTMLALLVGFDPNRLQEPLALAGFFAMLFVLVLFGATQDIASDGLNVRLLSPRQRPWGNAVQVVGSRLGQIIGGGGVLLGLGLLGWPAVFALMALGVALNTLPILWFREPQWRVAIPEVPVRKSSGPRRPWDELWQGITDRYGYFWQAGELRHWLAVLLLCRMGDGLSAGMVKPMMVDLGYSMQTIGVMAGIVGSLASLLGALLGAGLLRWLDTSRALLGLMAVQTAVTAGYGLIWWWHQQGHAVSAWVVFGFNAWEHLLTAMALIPLLTLAMHYARSGREGSDYTFQVCMLATLSGLGHLLSGWMAEYLGYAWHFWVCTVVGLVMLWPIVRWLPYWQQGGAVRLRAGLATVEQEVRQEQG